MQSLYWGDDMNAEDKYSKLRNYIDTWLEEKAEHVLTDIVRLYEDLKKRKDLPKGFNEDFESYFARILHNSTVILSFASNGQGAPEDIELILKKGRNRT